jgi:hypothetical protein
MASTPFGFEEILYEATLHFTKVTDYGFSVANVSRESPGEYSESGVQNVGVGIARGPEGTLYITQDFVQVR